MLIAFIAFVSTIIQSISDVFRKKSLGYGVGGKAHDLMGYPIGVLVLFYFYFTGVDFSKVNFFLVIGMILVLIISILKTQLYQKIYRKEKISLIMPYTNVNKILTIILSFFIFKDVSLTSLLITFVAIFFIIGFSIDFKSLKLPKTVGLLLFGEVIAGLLSLTMGRLIINYGVDIYFILFVITGVIILTILTKLLGEFKTLKGATQSFYINRFISGLGWISWFLSLIIIKELGLSVGILLSFIGIGITLLFSFIFLGDKPTKKDIFLTVIVSTLVGIGFLYK